MNWAHPIDRADFQDNASKRELPEHFGELGVFFDRAARVRFRIYDLNGARERFKQSTPTPSH